MLRVDDANTREERREVEGPFAPFAQMYADHARLMARALLPGFHICIDESIVNFYGSSLLKLFLASKPGELQFFGNFFYEMFRCSVHNYRA